MEALITISKKEYDELKELEKIAKNEAEIIYMHFIDYSDFSPTDGIKILTKDQVLIELNNENKKLQEKLNYTHELNAKIERNYCKRSCIFRKY